MSKRVFALCLWAVLIGLFSAMISGVAKAAPSSLSSPPAQNPAQSASKSIPNGTANEKSAANQSTQPSVDDPSAPQEEASAPSVSALVSADEKRVDLSASGGVFAKAQRVTFTAWSETSGKESLIAHEAVQQADGSWKASAFIASNSFDDPGVPYNCRVQNAVHRLYNPWTTQHFYTNSTNEADSLSRGGWRYEGVSWVEPQEDAFSPTDAASSTHPVYRLYNPTTGDHFFTGSKQEYDALASVGWKQEGQAFLSCPQDGIAIYRLYYPGRLVGAHLYTSSLNEYQALAAQGWQPEGIGWYGSALNADATWCAKSANRFHDSPGTYRVEAQVVLDPSDSSLANSGSVSSDTASVVADTSFSISQPTGEMRIANINNAQGTYDVVVSNVRSTSGISHVYVPSWTQAHNQQDIRWYEASHEPDGSYKATVNVRNHAFEQNFMSHAYVKAGNGVMINVGQSPVELTLANFIKKEGGPYTYTISIYNPGNVSSITMPTWSQNGWQDDIVWYKATNQGNGWWQATIDTHRLFHSGTCYTHVYADGELRGGLEYSIQPWEILEEKYRAMNERVNGLKSPSRYLVAVDNAHCFVGIYEGSQGNWKNLAYWDCAPGKATTPTIKGIFSVGNRGYVFGHGYSCYYWVQFYSDYLFHSIKYYEGTFTVLDGTLGSPASLGCVRLQIDHAKWIYDNIPRGTTVLSY